MLAGDLWTGGFALVRPGRTGGEEVGPGSARRLRVSSPRRRGKRYKHPTGAGRL